MAKGNPNIKNVGKSTRFSKERQPANNGMKGKSVTQWLTEYGEAKELSFEVQITKPNGEIKKNKGKVQSVTTINQLVAITIINKAINGDNAAIKEYLDRTEGRPKQNHILEGGENPIDIIDYSKLSMEALREIIAAAGQDDTDKSE